MTEIVQFFMYLSAAINLLMLKVNTSDILSSNITQSAIGALFAVLGPGWLGATVFNAPHNLHIIQNDVGKTIQHMPWLVMRSCSCSSDDCYFTNSNSIDYGTHRHEYGNSTHVFCSNGTNIKC